jgi:hypothetical protein
MGREAQEAKLQEQLEKLRKKAKSKPSKTKKPMKMDRESVEKRLMEELERIRLKRKGTPPTSARKRSSVPMKAVLSLKESAGVIPKLGPASDLAKLKAQAKKLGLSVKVINDIFKGKNKGGMMSKNKNYGKAYGKAYRAGGMTIKVVSCGASRKPTQKGTPKGKGK